jgi:hypothetical protein
MYLVTNLETGSEYDFYSLSSVYAFFAGRRLATPYRVKGPGFTVRVTFK